MAFLSASGFGNRGLNGFGYQPLFQIVLQLVPGYVLPIWQIKHPVLRQRYLCTESEDEALERDTENTLQDRPE